MKLLGERIKKRRETLHMALNDLSRRVGVSSSALSQIENAKAFPSILTLKAIADNLHTTVSELIGEHEALSKNPLIHYTEKKFVNRNNSGASLYLLTPRVEHKQMDTALIIFNEGTNSENLLKKHHGQTYLFLIKGELSFKLDDEDYTLKKNDSLYFNSNRQHVAINKSHREAHLLVVNTPPHKELM
ncbi:MAG: XRE family transcriptional regulator [Bacteroidales bacterium]|nr:XRE family transcriptional regulator [Bacteroidales bacterium]